MGFFSRLFTQNKQLLISGYWCETPIKLSYKFHTPLGGNVTVIIVCVDIRYHINKFNEIVIKHVQLSSECSIGNKCRINMASDRTGEAWYASSISPKSILFDVVTKELKLKKSKLKRIMFGKHNNSNPSPTDKQIHYASILGIKISPTMSKHDVSCAIDEVKSKR